MKKQKFGIFSPILGEKKNFPTILLDKTVQTDNRDIVRMYGEVWRRKKREPDMLDSGSDKFQTPDTYPILHYHTFIKRSTGMQYKLAFTKEHIYVWNPSTEVWDEIWECASFCTEWDTVSYNDCVIATNFVDKVLVWDTSGDFAALDDSTNGVEYSEGKYLTKAKYVSAFESFLILGYTYEDSILYPQRERWSAIGEGEVTGKWKTGDAGAKETYGSDVIMGFKIYAGQFVIFKAKSRIIQKLVATSAIWNWVILPGNIGLLSNHSVVEDPDGRVYWLANDFTIREMDLGEISQLIDPIVKLIEPSSAHLVYGIYIDETGEIWWSIPYDNALNNKVITLKVVNGVVTEWGELNLAVPAFGSYKEA